MNRLAVFDCDGTLVDSGATISAALAESFGANGIAVPKPEACRRIIGLSLVEAIARLTPELGDDDHRRLAEDYKSAFMAMRAAGRVEEPLFEGVLDLLDALEHDGWLLAVATGKSDRGLRHCLETHGIHARFVSLQTADRHPSKPHPSMVEQAIVDAAAEPGVDHRYRRHQFRHGDGRRRRCTGDWRWLGLPRARRTACRRSNRSRLAPARRARPGAE